MAKRRPMTAIAEAGSKPIDLKNPEAPKPPPTAPAKPQAGKAKPKPKRQKSAGTAQQIAAELAAKHKVDLKKSEPLTPAERRARRREKMTPVSFELPHEIAAKLVVLAAADDTTQREIVETLIDRADIGGVLSD